MTFVNISLEIFALGSVIVTGLLVRLVQYVRFRYPGGMDVFFHLLYMENLDYFFENVRSYPYLFHIFCRKVKDILKLSNGKLIMVGLFPDIIAGLGAYFFIRGPFGVIPSIIALALFIATPRLVHQSIFSPRSMGLLMYVLSLLALTLPFPLNALSILFVSLTALTHRLSIQTLFFVMLVYSFFDVTSIVNFVLGLLLALVISKRRYYQVLRSHLSYLKLMITKRQFRYPNREHLVFISAPYAIIAPLCILALLGKKIPEPIYSWTRWLSFSVKPFLDEPLGCLLLTSGLVSFLLVFLWRWGDSHRFIVYGSLPLAVLYSEATMSNRFLYFLLPLVLLGNVFLSLYITKRNTLITRSFSEAVRFLSKVLDDGFCSPSTHYWAVKYFTNGEGVYIDIRDPSYIVKPKGEEVRRFKYFIVPNSMVSNLKPKYKLQLLFSNEEWTTAKVSH